MELDCLPDRGSTWDFPDSSKETKLRFLNVILQISFRPWSPTERDSRSVMGRAIRPQKLLRHRVTWSPSLLIISHLISKAFWQSNPWQLASSNSFAIGRESELQLHTTPFNQNKLSESAGSSRQKKPLRSPQNRSLLQTPSLYRGLQVLKPQNSFLETRDSGRILRFGAFTRSKVQNAEPRQRHSSSGCV